MRWNIVVVISEGTQIGLDRLELLPPRVANFHHAEKRTIYRSSKIRIEFFDTRDISIVKMWDRLIKR